MCPSPGCGPRRAALGRLSSAALRVALLLAIACASSARGSSQATPASGGKSAAQAALGPRVEVASVLELRDALQDQRVTHVALLPSGNLSLSRRAWGDEPVLLHRAVLLEGIPAPDGQPPYVDAAQLAELVVVGANGTLRQRGLFVDACLLPAMPLLCLAAGASGGRLLLDQMVLGDASCTSIHHSAATNWLLKAAYTSAWQSSWRQLDERSLHVADTGEVWSMIEGVRWRIVNSTLRCTRNETQPLASTGSSRSSIHEAQMALSLLATVVALLAGLHWQMNRDVVYAQPDESAEEAAARAMGIVLLGVIGKGTLGSVFRARYEGRTVAVKLVRFKDADGQAAADAANECRLAMAACSHPCIAACLAHSTVTVRADVRRRQRLQASSHTPPGTSQLQLLNQWLQEQQRRLRQQQGQQPQQQEEGSCSASTTPGSLSGSTGSNSSNSIGTSSGGGGARSTRSNERALSSAADGFVSLLVMEHCRLGNLHQAITAGRFHACRSNLPNLDWVLRTGLDVALALQYLHDECGIVHRDVSTNNILLTPDRSDFRGFRAKLSDFGLSMELMDGQAHTTSQLKGTVHFMPPEVFTSGEVHYATDVYSLGIVLYWMVAGEEPYAGLAPYQVVGKKLEEAHRQQRLQLPPSMPPELQALVWACTHRDPQQRLTAAQAARRLAGLLCKLPRYTCGKDSWQHEHDC